jgi:hypothetical protein
LAFASVSNMDYSVFNCYRDAATVTMCRRTARAD